MQSGLPVVLAVLAQDATDISTAPLGLPMLVTGYAGGCSGAGQHCLCSSSGIVGVGQHDRRTTATTHPCRPLPVGLLVVDPVMPNAHHPLPLALPTGSEFWG